MVKSVRYINYYVQEITVYQLFCLKKKKLYNVYYILKDFLKIGVKVVSFF